MISVLCLGSAFAADDDLDDLLEDLDDPDLPEDDPDDDPADDEVDDLLEGLDDDPLPAPAPRAASIADLEPEDLAGLRTPRSEAVPHRHVGLGLAIGGVYAQKPLSGDVTATLGVRPQPGLRLDAEVGAWLGTAYLPGTPRIVPVAVPMGGLGVAYEAPTTGTSRPWIGASVVVSEATRMPLALAPIATARVGVDVGRGLTAWTVAAYGGVMVCPALPALAGPSYRAVAPVFGVRTGPSVRL